MDNEKRPNWNSDLLNIYLSKIMEEKDRASQQRWEAQEKAVSAALSAAEKAVAAALIAQEKAVANAFNAQEKAVDSALNTIESNTKSLADRIDDLRVYRDTSTGKVSGLNSGWVFLLGIVSLLGGIVSFVLTFRK